MLANYMNTTQNSEVSDNHIVNACFIVLVFGLFGVVFNHYTDYRHCALYRSIGQEIDCLAEETLSRIIVLVETCSSRNVLRDMDKALLRDEDFPSDIDYEIKLGEDCWSQITAWLMRHGQIDYSSLLDPNLASTKLEREMIVLRAASRLVEIYLDGIVPHQGLSSHFNATRTHPSCQSNVQ